MPVHTYKIESLDDGGLAEDTYNFQDLIGEPQLSSKRIEILSRRGVDGVGLRDVGSIPEPFQLLGIAYFVDFAAAKDGADLLRALIGHTYGCRLTINSVDWGVFDVLEVRPEPARACGAVVGSLVENATCVQRCILTLIERTPAEDD